MIRSSFSTGLFLFPPPLPPSLFGCLFLATPFLCLFELLEIFLFRAGVGVFFLPEEGSFWKSYIYFSLSPWTIPWVCSSLCLKLLIFLLIFSRLDCSSSWVCFLTYLISRDGLEQFLEVVLQLLYAFLICEQLRILAVLGLLRPHLGNKI